MTDDSDGGENGLIPYDGRGTIRKSRCSNCGSDSFYIRMVDDFLGGTLTNPDWNLKCRGCHTKIDITSQRYMLDNTDYEESRELDGPCVRGREEVEEKLEKVKEEIQKYREADFDPSDTEMLLRIQRKNLYEWFLGEEIPKATALGVRDEL